MPENAAQLLELKLGAELAAAEPLHTGRPPSRRAFQGWLTQLAPSMPIPLPGFFTTQVVTDHGGFNVFPAFAEDSEFVVECLLGVLDHLPIPKDKRERGQRLVLTLLRLSDVVATRAGLTRNAEPLHRPNEPALIPQRDRLERLIDAVTFSPADLNAILAEDDQTLLGELTLPSKSFHLSEDPESSLLTGRPLVQWNDEFIVASPDSLLAACLTTFHRMCLENNGADAFSEWLLVAVSQSVFSSLAELGLLASTPAPEPEEFVYSRVEALLPFDRDKVVHLMVLSDDFEDLSQFHPASTWSAPDRETLERRFREVAWAVSVASDPPNEVLHLIVVQSSGRRFSVIVDSPSDESPFPRLVLSAWELQSLSRAESGNIMALWELAMASHDVRRRVRLPPLSQFEEYAYFRSHRYDFGPLESTRSAHLIGFSRVVRMETGLQQDRHALLAPPQDRYLPVVRAPEFAELSVFQLDRPTPALTSQKIVEIDSCSLWIVGRDLTSVEEEAPLGYPPEFASYERLRPLIELIALWLTLLGESSREFFEELAGIGRPVVITVLLLDENARSDVTPWTVEVDAGNLEIEVRFEDVSCFGGSTNAKELDLIHDIVRGLGVLVPEAHTSEAAVHNALDDHLGAGTGRRMFVRLTGHETALVSARSIYRLVSPVQVTRVARSVGELLRASDVFDATGEVPRADVNRVLNEAVSKAFRSLQSLVATLNPRDLLEWLVSLQEELIHQGFQSRVHAAVYAGAVWHRRAPGEHSDRGIDHTMSSVANRFLIEYVTASPPAGSRPISLTVYDELLAMASLIVEWGALSDVEREGLAEVSAGVAPWGRFIAGSLKYADQMHGFAVVMGQETLDDAIDWVAARLEASGEGSHEETEAEVDVARIDQAFHAERGFSLREQVEAFQVLVDRFDDDVSVGVLPLEAAIEEIAQRLQISSERSLKIVDELSLSPRGSFLEPSSPFRPPDVYPWRFGRPMSCLYRPLLIRNVGSERQLVFGRRLLEQSIEYLLKELEAARYPAQSRELSRVMASIQQSASLNFNRAIADLYRIRGDLRVRERFRKIEGKPLRDERGEVGDVDVLVADIRRRLILCIETKRLAGARVPYQVARELQRTFGGGNWSGPTSLQKHLRRVRWVGRHKKDVLEALDIHCHPVRRWKVQGVLITDEPVTSAFLVHSPMPVRSFRELKRAHLSGRLY